MPEILEIELYRREMNALIDRRVETVECPDLWFVRRAGSPAALATALEGGRVTGLRRHGKLLLIDLLDDSLPTDVTVLGLRFGMTGRPVVDDRPAPVTLEYAPAAALDKWVRFGLRFEGDGRLRIVDPRRLGGVELDPDLGHLGPDVLTLTFDDLRVACRSAAAVKTVLLDQRRLAGLGNMLADEVLWRASIDPGRPAVGLDDGEIERLRDTIFETLPELLRRGGSHLGDLSAGLRRPGGRCPRDGAELVVRRFGGRTTYSCPLHQRRT